MACISVPTAILGSAVLATGGSLLSSQLSSGAATQAGTIQSDAAKQALALQQGEFNVNRDNLQPFLTVGTNAAETLANLVGAGNVPGTRDVMQSPLTAPISTTFAPTIENLEKTPGYQFSLSQGEKATQNYLASQGLARSGAAGIAQDVYAQGVAGTTFQQQFNNWLAQQNLTLAQRQQVYNMLGGLTTQGEAAGANVGSLGIQSTAQQTGSILGAGAAQAAGVVGSTNALTSGISGVTGAGSNAALLLALNNSGMFGPQGAAAIPAAATPSLPAWTTGNTTNVLPS